MDHTGGLNVAYALLLALYRRRKTGQGGRIDLSMYETGVSCIAPAVLEVQRGINRPRLGTAHLWKAPHNVYRCQETDRWIVISISSDDDWQRFRSAMGQPSWAMDAKFDTVPGRWRHRHKLDEQLEHWTSTYDNMALMHLLQAHQVTAGAVLTARDLVIDPHLRQREYFEVFTNANAPRVGVRVYAGRPFRIPNIPESLSLVSALGQHNDQILREVAKLSEPEMQQLLAAGILATRPKDAEKPAATPSRADGRGRGPHFDPDYPQYLRQLGEPLVAAPGSDD
jgi:crotonobetainyl-CoA:carnitine CoA-transferase CaiB-like acyl-CoA transferase